MVKERMTVFLEPSDRGAVKVIRQVRKLDSDGAAIRYAIREIAEQLRKDAGSGENE